MKSIWFKKKKKKYYSWFETHSVWAGNKIS